MGILNEAGDDLNIGAMNIANIRVHGNGWYNAFDNTTTVTLTMVLAADAYHRRKSTQKWMVTLGVTTNVTCAAAVQTIGLSATQAAGTYLITFEASNDGVIVKSEVVD